MVDRTAAQSHGAAPGRRRAASHSCNRRRPNERVASACSVARRLLESAVECDRRKASGADVAADLFERTAARTENAFVRRNFFFQAEDGIRDLTVTGVQTCALPI